MYYKKRHILDFPRTLNDLIGTSEPDYQALVFKRILQKQGYFTDTRGVKPTAEVLTWDEFEKMFGDTAHDIGNMAPASITVSSDSGSGLMPSTTDDGRSP